MATLRFRQWRPDVEGVEAALLEIYPRKARRAYLFDCAAAHDEQRRGGARNLVACCLLKFVQFRRDAAGESWDLFYLRDKEEREVDFVVTRNRRVHWLIAVTSSDADVSPSLKYYTTKLQPPQSLQLVSPSETSRGTSRHQAAIVQRSGSGSRIKFRPIRIKKALIR
jgi:hypothetical protein